MLIDLEASFFRYLYETLEVAHGVTILDDITLRDYDGLSKWVVIDSLTNNIGPQPKQLYFLHIAVQKGGENEKDDLIRLVDLVMQVIYYGAAIPVYSYASGEVIGGTQVVETSLSPVMPHFSGGKYRSMTVGLVYQA